MTTDQYETIEQKLVNAEKRLADFVSGRERKPSDENPFEKIYLDQLIVHNQARVDRLRAALGLV